MPLDTRGFGLGDLDVGTAVLTLVDTAVKTGGTVGSALITADATKYVAKQQERTQLLSNLAAVKSQQEQTQTQSSATTTQLAIVAVAAVALGAIVARALRKRT